MPDDGVPAGPDTPEAPSDSFSGLFDLGRFVPLDDDSWIATTDVVGSTKAIAEGRYKAVNMAGAAAISAVMNKLSLRDFPFAFAGDGAALVVTGTDRAAVEDALARTVAWSRTELDLELRAAIVSLAAIRAAGHDVRLAHYAPSAAVRYAMFAGGGIAWAEEQMKAGNHLIAAAPAGAMPDLTGLSCRWQPMETANGTIVALIARPQPSTPPERFAAISREVLAIAGRLAHDGHPVPPDGPRFGSPFTGFALERRAEASRGKGFMRTVSLLAWRVFAWIVVRTGLEVGGFRPDHYRRQTALNSDDRKLHDGLMMTLDCTHELADAIDACLAGHAAAGEIRYGLSHQSHALMTCLVPSFSRDDHFHFIDGAGGGYAAAAAAMKEAALPHAG